MFYPFLVADPRSGLQYRLTDTGLAELSLAPKAQEWAPGRVIAEDPHPVWRESLANAPVETISSVSAALEGLGSRLIKLDPQPERRQFDHRQEVA